jgi:hypothetical protein
LCRSDFSVSILWAFAVRAIAMVKTMVFCMPKFPPIPASLQKVGPRPRFRAPSKNRWPNPPVTGIPIQPSGESEGNSEFLCLAGVLQDLVGYFEHFDVRQDLRLAVCTGHFLST